MEEEEEEKEKEDAVGVTAEREMEKVIFPVHGSASSCHVELLLLCNATWSCCCYVMSHKVSK